MAEAKACVSTHDQTMSDRRKAPNKAESALLDPFEGLPLSRVLVPANLQQFEEAASDLLRHRFVGFDTESRPTFTVGEVSDGPHVAQFATPDHAYIFQTWRKESHAVLKQLMESTHMVKVGFDLKSDRGHLQRKLDIHASAVLDLDTLFRQDGYQSIGVRAAVALTLNQKFHKSKHVTTSNWGLRELSDKQLLYAANDAYAALKVLQALNRPASELPIAFVDNAPV